MYLKFIVPKIVFLKILTVEQNKEKLVQKINK